jgi:hypothetical protein
MTVGEWPISQLVARALVALGPVLGLAVLVPAGSTPSVWTFLLVLVLAAGWAYRPESVVGTLVLVVVLGWWVRADLPGLPAEALVAALGLLTSHVAALVAAYGPPRMVVGAPTTRLWLTRAGVLFLGAPAVWLLARLLEDRSEPDGVWVAAMVAVTVGVVVAALAYGSLQGDAARDA